MINLTVGISMELNELYKRLGSWINIREKIRKEMTAIRKDSKTSFVKSSNRILSLEAEYERVQQEIIEIDRQIRRQEKARVSL